MDSTTNTILCIISAMLIGASIMTSLTCQTCPPHSTFLNSLDDSQRTTYKAIVDQRRNHYLVGLILGLIVATVMLLLTGDKAGQVMSGCFYTATVLIVQYIYYILMPKLPPMKNSLSTVEQQELWTAVHASMQRRYHGGALLGLLGFATVPYLLTLFKN